MRMNEFYTSKPELIAAVQSVVALSGMAQSDRLAGNAPYLLSLRLNESCTWLYDEAESSPVWLLKSFPNDSMTESIAKMMGGQPIQVVIHYKSVGGAEEWLVSLCDDWAVDEEMAAQFAIYPGAAHEHFIMQKDAHEHLYLEAARILRCAAPSGAENTCHVMFLRVQAV